MRFCPDCHNMLHTFEGNQIKCRSCPYAEDIPTLVYERSLEPTGSARLTINPYLVHDPTLPRFSHMECINPGCTTRTDPKLRDVVGIKEDRDRLVWTYVCAVCKTQWSQAARG